MPNKNVFLLPMIALALVGCGGGNTPAESASSEQSSEESIISVPTYDGPSLSIHYHREKSDYSGFALWLWEKNGDGAEYAWNGTDAFGAVAAYPLSTWENALTVGMGCIIKSAGSWSKQTPDISLDFSTLTPDAQQVYHVYFEQGDNDIYDGNLYHTSNTEGISVAEFTDETTLRVVGSKTMSSIKVFEDGVDILTHDLSNPSKSSAFSLPQGKEASFEHVYSVEVTFAASGAKKTKGVALSALYDTASFKSAYNYDGVLGPQYSSARTIFSVWSPVSSSIKLRLYNNGTPTSVDPANGSDAFTEVDMVRGEKGVFSATVEGDLEGKYYTYVVTNASFEATEVVDPYAKACGINGLRGMVCDFSLTNPEGWDDVEPFAYDRKALTVYETHVADVTSSGHWGGSSKNARKYAGLIETGTTYTSGGTTVTTGFDHIKELGVNAVQLLPIFDQANDETSYSFNWGYNPLNYNCVEGIYSSNPYDGHVRIQELKEVVKSYHKAGINIIMDVVYNHVNGASGSNFDVLMPGYYYRYTASGALSNGSGCGNETASERPMMRKFMIDSTSFWAREYKLGGFRFDLMGLHDLETMNRLTAEAKKINPGIVIYGEPWAGGTSALSKSLSAIQANGNSYQGYGQFNDGMRDALIKGGLNGPSAKGWVTNNTSVSSGDVKAIQEGINGTTYQTSVTIADPNKTVNYVTCHDNYTLYDRIEAAEASSSMDETRKMAVLANSVVFTSEGTSFMLAGEEFLRSKGGNSNSYNAGDNVNKLLYGRKITYPSVFENYKALIAFKKNTAGLHLDKPSLGVASSDGGATLSYALSGEGVEYRVIHTNGVGTKSPIDLSGYTVYLDTLGELSGDLGVVTPKAYQTIIASKAI